MSEPIRVALDGLRTDCARIEAAAVKAIEIAVQAWQDSSSVKTALTKVRQEAADAADKAKRAMETMRKTREQHQKISLDLAAYKRLSIKAEEATAEAELNAKNAVAAVTVAEKAVEVAERETSAKYGLIAALQENVRMEAGVLKEAKKVASDATAKAEEAGEAEKAAKESLEQAQENVLNLQQAAQKATKKSYTLTEEEDEAARAYQAAHASAQEFEGQGGEWERRTQKTLKDREADHKRVSANLKKTKAAEVAAESAYDEALDAVAALNEEIEKKKDLSALAEEETKKMADLQASAQQVYNKAEGEAAQAIFEHKTAEGELKKAKAAAAATTVTKLEEMAAAAREEEKNTKAKEADFDEKATAAKEAGDRAAAERERLQAIAGEKESHVHDIAKREHEALHKEKVVIEHLKELEEKVYVLAQSTYESRMGAPAYWTREEAEVTAEEARQARRELASQDARALAMGTKALHLDMTVLDKWQLFKLWGEENWSTVDMWNVKNAFFNREGHIITGIAIMVADIVGAALDRGPPDPKQCIVKGEGLSSASIAEKASFQILACSSHGIRFEDGGDTFTVSIRFAGQCSRVTAKLVDNDDGSYDVSYVPRSTGVCTISVSLAGEQLPGSPYACVVAGREGPAPCASQCTVSGDALGKVVAHNAEHFFISFRDSRGRLAHASDLDVWVQPVDSSAGSSADGVQAAQAELEGFPPEVAQLLMPPGAFDSFVVGSSALDVSRTPDLSSVRIGRLPPGRTLKIDKIEPPTEDGLIRARVRLDLEDLKEDSSTWRELWPQQQPWRSLSWRAHRIAEIKREDEEAEALAIAYEIHLEERRQNAAHVMQAVHRGKESRKITNKMHQKRRAMLAAEAAAAAAIAAGIPLPEPPVAPPGRGNKKGDKRRNSVAPKPPKDIGKKVKEADAPAPAPSATPTKKEAKEKKGEDSPSPKPKKGNGTAKEKKGKKGSKAAEAEAEEAAVAAAALEASIALAATRIQKIARSKAARKTFQTAREAAAAAAASASRAKGKGGKKGSKKGARKSAEVSFARKSAEVATSSSIIRDAQARYAAASAEMMEKRSKVMLLSTTPKLPSSTLYAQSQEDMYGWVTLATTSECYVAKQTGRLPIKLRLQHEQHWLRRNAVDSERELLHAKERNTSLDNEKTKGARANATVIPHDHHAPSGTSSRLAYRNDLLALDPKRIGFAYGSAHPGRLHAKGQLVEKHEVSFSIDVSGSYMLYVNLRQPHTPWASASGPVAPRTEANDWAVPGSPFLVRVAPSKLNPMTTAIPMEKQPLKGMAQKDPLTGAEIYMVDYTLQGLDKMGNMCDVGGAQVTCGFMDHASEAGGMPLTDVKAEPTGQTTTPGPLAIAHAPAPAPAPAAARVQTFRTNVVDVGDGTYDLNWFAPSAGSYGFWVKIDDLHVLGSPGVMNFFAAPPPRKRENKAFGTPSFVQKADPAAASRMSRDHRNSAEHLQAEPVSRMSRERRNSAEHLQAEPVSRMSREHRNSAEHLQAEPVSRMSRDHRNSAEHLH